MDKYIAEIAGKDSVAAVLSFASEHHNIEIIPTVVITGTEYGDMTSYEKSIDFLMSRMAACHIRMTDAIYLQDGALWNCINARYQYELHSMFQFYTPCITCHLYTHLLRIPIYKKYDAKGLITGERKAHSGKLKANQHKSTIEIFDQIFENSGIKFIRPLLEISDSDEIDAIIGEKDILLHANDVKCVMSGNLKGFSLETEEHIICMEKYLEKYVLPVGRFCAERTQKQDSIDIDELEQQIRGIIYD